MLADVVTDPYLTFIARIIVGGALLIAGVTKVLDRTGLAKSVEQFQVLPRSLARSFARVLPWLELVIGGALLVGLWTRSAAASAVLLLGAFSIAIGVNLARGRALDCHCFGNLHRSQLSSATLARNLLLVVIAAQPAITSQSYFSVDGWLRESESRTASSSSEAIIVIFSVVALAAFWFMVHGLWLLLKSGPSDEGRVA